MSATNKRKPTPDEIAAIRARIAGLSHSEKVALAARTAPILEKRGKKSNSLHRIPQTDDELHAAIIRETGFSIPRVSVCDDHCAPFDLVADGFFHRVAGILNLKSREAGGTLNASILQYMLCKYLAGHEGVQLGAIRDQAEKAFCVTADTLIDCPRNSGGIPVSEVQPGQLVWTFNREDHRFERKCALKVWASAPRAEVWKLTLNSGDVIRATPEHRFLRCSNEWCELKDLRPGDWLKSLFAPRQVVSTEPDGYEEVWDMEVEDNHNFIVHDVVLHNSYVKRFTEERIENEDGSITKRIKPEIDGEPLQKRIAWVNAALLQIIIATVTGVNSPHPNTVHADEVDLMDQGVIDQAANMSSSTLLADGTRIPALDLIVSTRKTMHGPMQKLIDEVEEAKEKGYEASYEIFSYCIFEVAEEVPNCRCAEPEARCARLKELDQDQNSLCVCDRVVKGEWSEDVPRTLETVCRGKFFRSRGWMAHEDVKRKFRKNSQALWEAEMECRRPMADGLYLPGWTRQRFTVSGWMPRPEFGNCWLGVDWGGTALSFILYSQGPLRVPVTVQGPQGPVTVPRNAYVIFDELYEADIGAGKLGDRVVAKEVGWRRMIPGFRITARFPDMAGKQQRDDWREHDPPLRTVWYLPDRQKEPMIKNLQDLVGDKRYWVDSRCSRHMDDIESWRQKAGREVHDDATHSMASSRYLHANTEALERRKQHHDPADNIQPAVIQRGQSHLGVATVGGGDSFAGERFWRQSMGESFPRHGSGW